MTKKITSADLRTLLYFWEEKGDITRWCDYEKKLPFLTKDYPEVAKVIQDYYTAEKLLTLVLKAVQQEDDDDYLS